MKIGDKVNFICEFENPKMKLGHKYKGTVVKQTPQHIWVKSMYGFYKIPKADVEVLQRPAQKQFKAPTASDYKLFADTCFELGVRWRDGWKSIISGKQFKERDYQNLHAGHYISRACWATRHLPVNCHAITQGENYAMSRGCVKTISAYTDWLKKHCGDWQVEKLNELSTTKTKQDIIFLHQDCAFCFTFLKLHCPNGDALAELSDRIKSWDKARKERIANVARHLELGII